MKKIFSKPRLAAATVLMLTGLQSAHARDFAADPYSDELLQQQIERAYQIQQQPDFSKLDRNQDESINPEEAEGDALLARQFSRFDRDANGQIDKTEFHRYRDFATEKHNRGFAGEPVSEPQE